VNQFTGRASLAERLLFWLNEWTVQPMSVLVPPLVTPSRASNPKPLVSPELALVDPALAAEERARLPEQPLLWRSLTAAPVRAEQRALHALASAALGVDEFDRPEIERSRRTWKRLAAVGVVTALVLLLLDVHADVGRTPTSAEGSEPAGAELMPDSTGMAPQVFDTSRGPSVPSKPAVPTASRQAAVSRRFAWAPVSGADSYRVELFRGSTRVFGATSRKAEITVPAQWTLAGKRRRLTVGEYRWYVWPIRAGKTAPNAIVQATLTVP
jgi:hypothetical protein